MDFIQAAILSVVEGITEFLPISSTGHLILASKILGIPQTEFVKSFEIIIQLGAILSIVVLYWKALLNPRIIPKIIVAFIPSAVVGLVFYKFIKGYLLGDSLVTVFALFVGGIILILVELFHKRDSKIHKLEEIPFTTALLIGLFQSISVIPGVSRAGATIIGGLILGVRRKEAAEFSFILAVPTMMAAATLDIFETRLSFSPYENTLLLTGFIGSFLIALVTVKLFLKFISRNTFIPFGIYRIIVAILFFLIFIR